ncbi:unnamed protein product [Vicia faba]|uniref:Uncharacterized protein n=1 Tax=Vicia faba TaxID=3906 RepID=A0AAV1A6N9_VICFA|nr:unnamed protein product [Vicia faba]
MNFYKSIGVVINNGKVDGRFGGPPNFDLPTLVKTKSVNYSSGGLVNQKHYRLFGEDETGVLKSRSKIFSEVGNENNVQDILPNMLIKSQVHKESDHVHEDDVTNTTITNDDVVSNHDNTLGYVKTLRKGVMINNENILLDFITNSKRLRLISKNTQSMDDMPP